MILQKAASMQQSDDSEESQLLDLDEPVDVGQNTEITGTDIDDLKHQICQLTQEVNTLKKERKSAKFCISNVASNDKKLLWGQQLTNLRTGVH